MDARSLSSRPITTPPVLVLTRAELAGLLRPRDYLEAVERGFGALGAGQATAPSPMHIRRPGGGFHVKAAALDADEGRVAFKINGNFPDNPARGAPTIQGVVVLFDAGNGTLLAIMDSIEITRRRTAAATALAARFLARPQSSRILICGCGDQALAQLEALADVLPIRDGFAFDLDAARTDAFVRRTGDIARLTPVGPGGFAEAAKTCDVIVTCTTARRPFLGADHVRPGAFVAAVGADSPDKSEIDPDLMTRSRVVVDVLSQALDMGDLRGAVAAGVMAPSDVAGELADLVSGRVAGRRSEDEVTLFDSTGAAIQDVASAVVAFERDSAAGIGTWIALGQAPLSAR